MHIKLFIGLSLAIFAAAIGDGAPSGNRVLALLDDMKIRWTHSQFFKGLEDRGYSIAYHAASDPSIRLKKYGEWSYDHLILFAPSSSDYAGVTAASVLEFIDAGHNVVLAADAELGGPLRDIASECNVEFDEDGTHVIDHFSYDASDSDGLHTRIAASELIDVPLMFGGRRIDAPILFDGIAQDIEEHSPLLYNVLRAPATAYSAEPDDAVPSEVFVAGSKIALVSALQARNNARVVVSGSLALFSDRFFSSPVQRVLPDGGIERFDKSGNELFAKLITEWAFHERGILRVKSVAHHKLGETAAPAFYTVTDDVEFSVELEQWDGQRWAPYVANDVQLEVRRIEPFVRLTLPPSADGRYTARFKVPDVIGVYTFKIEYVKPGYGFLTEIIRPVAVRPLRHNAYERWIAGAYPYYASSLSMLFGVLLFSAFFLYSS